MGTFTDSKLWLVHPHPPCSKLPTRSHQQLVKPCLFHLVFLSKIGAVLESWMVAPYHERSQDLPANWTPIFASQTQRRWKKTRNSNNFFSFNSLQSPFLPISPPCSSHRSSVPPIVPRSPSRGAGAATMTSHLAAAEQGEGHGTVQKQQEDLGTEPLKHQKKRGLMRSKLLELVKL